MAKEKNVMVIDPELMYQRKLHYMERHSGWEAFKAVYWAIYLLTLGIFLLLSPTGFSIPLFLGFALVLLAMFYAIFGLVVSLHFKLMKRHA